MPLLFDFGTSSGLAYRHNFNADMARLLQEEGIINNQKAAAEAKAMKYGDELKFSTGYTPYFQSKIDEVANNNINQIGKLLHENGNNPAASPMVWAQYKQLASQIGNNEWTVKSEAAKKEYEKFTGFLAENPDMMTDNDVQKQLNEWKEFKETGSVTKYDDKGEATHKLNDFVFINPLSKVDLNTEAQKFMAKIKPTELVTTATNAKGHYLATPVPSEKDLMAATIATLSDPKTRKVAEKEFNDPSNEAVAKQFNGNLNKWFAEVYMKPNQVTNSQILLDQNMADARKQAMWQGTYGQPKPTPEVKPQLLNAYEAGLKSPTGQAPLTAKGAGVLLGETSVGPEPGTIVASGTYNFNGQPISMAGVVMSPVPALKAGANNQGQIEAVAQLDAKSFEAVTGTKVYYAPGDANNLVEFTGYEIEPNKARFWHLDAADIEKYGAKPPKEGTITITPKGQAMGLKAKTEKKVGNNIYATNTILFPVSKEINVADENTITQYNLASGAPASITNTDIAKKEKSVGKTVVKKFQNKAANKTKIIYADGSEEIVEGLK